MVCVPCFIAPLLLFLWHRFMQPFILRFWNPWKVTDAQGNTKTEVPIVCEGGVCAFRRKPAEVKEEITVNVVASNTKNQSKGDGIKSE